MVKNVSVAASKRLSPENATKSKAFEMKKFYSDAQDEYINWLQEKCETEVSVIEPPEYHDYTTMLSGRADAFILMNEQTWPVMYKSIYQNPNAETRSLEDIINSRPNSYIEQNDKGEWKVKKGTDVWAQCNNICLITKCKAMVLVVYSQRDSTFIPIEVKFNAHAYKLNFAHLNEYVNEAASKLSMTKQKN